MVRARSLVVSELRFPVRVWLLAMCRSELSAVIGRLMSKCLWSGWKWKWRVKEILFHFSCSPVIRECSWKKTQIEKMVEITRTWISWKRNIFFLRNKIILNLWFRWYILTSYHFLAEINFKVKQRKYVSAFNIMYKMSQLYLISCQHAH